MLTYPIFLAQAHQVNKGLSHTLPSSGIPPPMSYSLCYQETLTPRYFPVHLKCKLKTI